MEKGDKHIPPMELAAAEKKNKNTPETPEEKIDRKNAEAIMELFDPEGVPEDIALRSMYARSAQDREVSSYELKTREPSSRVLHMTELMIGYQHSAVGFYEDTIDQIKEFPKDKKPHLIDISGLPMGDFKHYQKTRRKTLMPELAHMNEQFKYSRAMIEKAGEVGVPMIYNLSDDDKRIAEEYAFETLRKMENYTKPYKANQEIGFGQRDQLRHHPMFDELLQFQIHEVYPLNLQLGRRLYTAEEMSEETEGRLHIDEDLLLFRAHRIEKHNEQLPPEERRRLPAGYRQWLNRIERDKKDLNVTITDDVNLKTQTKGKSYVDWIRHDFGNLTPTSKKQNHMGSKQDLIGQMKASGIETPDTLVAQNDYEGAGVSDEGKWILSTPPMIRAKDYLNTRGSRTDAAGDIARRLATTRRRIPSPGAIMQERTDDGRDIFTIFNKNLNEKSESIPERLTVALHQDIQTGSTTSRHELEAKNLAYTRHLMGEQAVLISMLGDHVQGRNYPHFASESQMTGLMAMDTQEDFMLKFLDTAFNDLDFEELKSIHKVLAQNGNHEYNSGTTKWHGYSFITSFRQFFEEKFSTLHNRQLAREGYSDKQINEMVKDIVAKKVKSHEAMITPEGEYFQGYGDVEYVNDFGVLFQHTHLHRGGKGGGGNLPSYQADALMKGQGKLMESIDAFMQGHWHHPNFAVLGDKLSVTGGSVAGMSDYEFKRAHRPTIAGNYMHIGGNLPVQLEFASKDFLENFKIDTGGFSEKALKEEGYKDDPEFNAKRHGIYLPDDFPKSALQKKLLQMHRDSSQRSDRISEFK